jgi:hypothetical protein
MAKFELERSWKVGMKVFEIETANICCVCGISFELGQEWIVYANGNSTKGFYANGCSRTSGIENGRKDENFWEKRDLLPKRVDHSGLAVHLTLTHFFAVLRRRRSKR